MVNGIKFLFRSIKTPTVKHFLSVAVPSFSRKSNNAKTVDLLSRKPHWEQLKILCFWVFQSSVFVKRSIKILWLLKVSATPFDFIRVSVPVSVCEKNWYIENNRVNYTCPCPCLCFSVSVSVHGWEGTETFFSLTRMVETSQWCHFAIIWSMVSANKEIAIRYLT